jgi:hypothetical protein
MVEICRGHKTLLGISQSKALVFQKKHHTINPGNLRINTQGIDIAISQVKCDNEGTKY